MIAFRTVTDGSAHPQRREAASANDARAGLASARLSRIGAAETGAEWRTTAAPAFTCRIDISKRSGLCVGRRGFARLSQEAGTARGDEGLTGAVAGIRGRRRQVDDRESGGRPKTLERRIGLDLLQPGSRLTAETCRDVRNGPEPPARSSPRRTSRSCLPSALSRLICLPAGDRRPRLCRSSLRRLQGAVPPSRRPGSRHGSHREPRPVAMTCSAQSYRHARSDPTHSAGGVDSQPADHIKIK